MSFSLWLRNRKRFAPTARRRTQTPPRQRANFRPMLEALEDRVVPTVFDLTTNPTMDPSGAVKELIAAMNSANRAGGPNTIDLYAAGVYDLTAVNNTTNGANGLPVISGGGTKAAADNLTIDGNGGTIQRDSTALAFRLFDVASGGSLTLQNVTLQGGWASGSGAAADGGAIYNQGTLTLCKTIVQNNTAQGSDGAAADGGAVYNQGTLILNGATVQGNTARGSDGAAGGDSKNDKQFFGGQAGADAAGGGIWSSGTVTLQGGSTVQNNTATGGRGGAGLSVGVPPNQGGAGGGGFGGGLYEAGGNVSVSNATLAGNRAWGGQGGSQPANLKSIGRAGGDGFGGGLYEAGGSASVSNAILAGNTAEGGRGGTLVTNMVGISGSGGAAAGGGLYVAGGTLSMSNDTVKTNQALGGNGAQASPYFYNPDGNGGAGSGAGIYVGGGTVTLQAVELLSNRAQGGDGATSPGAGLGGHLTFGFGGNGLGGGLYVTGGDVTLTGDTVTGNSATAGESGFDGVRTDSPGVAGGGGIYIVSQAGGTVSLDSFTVANTSKNYDYLGFSLIGEDDIDGPYNLI
jgi:hypothetical protein